MAASVSLVDIINRFIESDAIILPVFNISAIRIQQELAKREPDLRVVERTITSDQALSSQVLKIANSSFYRGLSEVGTVRAAIMRLGMVETGKAVLVAASRHHFSSNEKSINLLMKKLWQHSVGCAYGAAWLARRHNYGVDQGQAFFAGLFHDVGKLFVLMVIEQIKRKNKAVNITEALLLEAMTKLHAREGGRLLARWNMPENFQLVAREHHSLDVDERNMLLILVRMANLVCNKLGISLESNPSVLLPATLEASLLNLSEIDLAELEITLEDTKALSA